MARCFVATPALRRIAVVVTGVVAACAPTDSAPRDDTPDAPESPDARFLTADPCAAPPAGVTLEETAAFEASDDPSPLIVLMGGGSEVDQAAIRFAEAANGGDVLVLRATGSTSSYTSWFASELSLSPAPRAVATARIDDPLAAAEDAVLCRVARADAVWLAGGDQSDYLLRWPEALHASLARAVARGVAIGGTSAGAMSLSALTFDAAHDTVDSLTALASPLSDTVSLSRSPFSPPATAGVLVDTHFSERDRLGRLIAFVARAAHEGEDVIGLGIDEESAVVIDDDSVQISGAGDAWLVSLDGDVALTDGAPLSGAAYAAPLSLQSSWPPVSGAQAPGAQRYVVTDGALPVTE